MLSKEDKQYADKLVQEFEEYTKTLDYTFEGDIDEALEDSPDPLVELMAIVSALKSNKLSFKDFEEDVLNLITNIVSSAINKLRLEFNTSLQNERNSAKMDKRKISKDASQSLSKVNSSLKSLKDFVYKLNYQNMQNQKSQSINLKHAFDIIEDLSNQVNAVLQKKYVTIKDVLTLLNNHEHLYVKHALEHLPDGNDPIPIVNDKTAGLMSPSMLYGLKVLAKSGQSKISGVGGLDRNKFLFLPGRGGQTCTDNVNMVGTLGLGCRYPSVPPDPDAVVQDEYGNDPSNTLLFAVKEFKDPGRRFTVSRIAGFPIEYTESLYQIGGNISFAGQRLHMSPVANSGVTIGGIVYGQQCYSIRNYALSTSDDNGTISGVTAQRISYGHFNNNPDAYPLSTTLSGLQITGFLKTGRASNMYDILILSDSAISGTASELTGYHYGIFEQNIPIDHDKYHRLVGHVCLSGDITVPETNLDIVEDQNDATGIHMQNYDSGELTSCQIEMEDQFSSSFMKHIGGYVTPSAYTRPSGLLLSNNYTGVDIASTGTAGDILFWSGGSNKRLSIDETGLIESFGEVIIDPDSGEIALDCQKDVKIKSTRKIIYDGD